MGSDESVADFTPEQQAAIDAAVQEQVEGLKKNQAELLKESKAAKAKLAAYDGIDPEEYKKLKTAAEEAEKKRLQGEGDYKQLEAQLVKKYEGLLEQEKGVSGRYRSAVEKHLIDAAAAQELAKHSDSPKLLLPHIRSRMKVVEQDGEFHARIVDESGNVRVGKGQGSSPMTLSELIEEMKQDKEYAPAFRGTGSSGGGATKSTGGAGGRRTISISELVLGDNAKKVAAGEVEVVG